MKNSIPNLERISLETNDKKKKKISLVEKRIRQKNIWNSIIWIWNEIGQKQRYAVK